MAGEMQSRVTQDEVIQMAIQMEELGRDFYEALGGATRDPRVFQLCHRLAAEEDKHREIIRRLHSNLAARGELVMLTDEQAAAARRRIRSASCQPPKPSARSPAAATSSTRLTWP